MIYRQDVFSEVTDHALTQAFVDYGEAMHLARTRLAQAKKRYDELFRQAWVLAAGRPMWRRSTACPPRCRPHHCAPLHWRPCGVMSRTMRRDR